MKTSRQNHTESIGYEQSEEREHNTIGTITTQNIRRPKTLALNKAVADGQTCEICGDEWGERVQAGWNDAIFACAITAPANCLAKWEREKEMAKREAKREMEALCQVCYIDVPSDWPP